MVACSDLHSDAASGRTMHELHLETGKVFSVYLDAKFGQSALTTHSISWVWTQSEWGCAPQGSSFAQDAWRWCQRSHSLTVVVWRCEYWPGHASE